MYKKILQLICVLGFFLVFGYFYADEYWQYREEIKLQEEYGESVREDVENFSFDNIVSLKGETQLYYTPYLGLLDEIVDRIDSADRRVWLEAYIFTETRMREAIIRAHKRGIDVRVLLENNPYKAPYLNDKAQKALQQAGVNVKWSDPLNYSLNHAKMLIVDEQAFVSTGNFSYSLFKHNRDFLIKIEDADVMGALSLLFENDFAHTKKGVIHPNIVLSPDNARGKISQLAKSAREKIDFYFPYISDDLFESELIQLAKKGIQIRGVVDKEFYRDEENTDILERFKSAGIDLRPISKGKLHAKSVLVDNKLLYVGSINFSRFSFDENREIGLILREKDLIEKFSQLFEKDF